MSTSETRYLGEIEVPLYPLDIFSGHARDADEEAEERALSALESYVCSILAATTALPIEEVGDMRRDRYNHWFAVRDEAAEWQPGPSESLLDGAEHWRLRGELTGRGSDFDRAESLAARADALAEGDTRQRAATRAALADIALSRAEAGSDLTLDQLAGVSAMHAIAANLEYGQTQRDEAVNAELAVDAMLRLARSEARRADHVVSARTADIAARTIASVRQVSGLWDAEWSAYAERELTLLDGIVEVVRHDNLGVVDRLHHDAAVSAFHAAYEAGIAHGDARLLSVAGERLARELQRRTDSLADGTGSDLLAVLKTALANCMPATTTCARLVAHWARVLYSAGREAGRDDLLLFGHLAWGAACSFVEGRDSYSRLDMAFEWARHVDITQDAEDALAAYEHAAAALDRLTREHSLIGERGVALAAGREVKVLAAAAYAVAGSAATAVEMAESGRSVLQRLQVPPEPWLAKLAAEGHADLAATYRAALAEERAAARRARPIDWPTSDASHDELAALLLDMRRAAAPLRESEAAIRALPGFEQFPDRSLYEGVRAAAADAPLVYLVPGLADGSALVVRSASDPEPLRVPLPALTYDRCATVAVDYRLAYRDWRPEHDELTGWPENLDAIGEWLWTAVMGPVLDALDGVAFARLVPLAHLGMLPLQLAWRPTPDGREYALDRIALAQVPSAALLSRALARPVGDAWSALLVDDPAGDLSPAAELDAARIRFPDGLRLADVRSDRLVEALASHNFAHISEHGFVDEVLPLASGIYLAGDDVLTVEDLRHAQLPDLEVLVLSSCESGMLGGRILDESMHFPGMVFGVSSRAVISAQWAVDQYATGEVFDRFYRRWDLSHEPAAIATALRDAQLDVRERHEHPIWWGGVVMMG